MDDTASSGVSNNSNGVNTPVKISQRTDEKDLRQVERLLKTLLSDKENSGEINVNIDVAGVRGEGHSIQNSIFKVTGVEVVLQRPPPAECLPERWKVPLRNNNFIGRKELLKQIEEHFSQESTPVILTAHGLGGIGKTQLALEFAWQHIQEYKGVVWFNAESQGRLQEDYINLGRELNIICDGKEEKMPAAEQARHVKHWLEHPSRAGWLLVYDNAANFASIKELIPSVKGGKVLVTSRYTEGWPQATLEVMVFTLEEAIAFIQKVLGDKASNIEQVTRLANALGRLPLALTQASAYIKQSKRVNIERYLGRYEEKKREILDSKILPADYPVSVYVTWDITMEVIRNESPLATQMLNRCACLASNDIPDFLLEPLAKPSGNNPTSQIFDFEEALDILNNYSMLTSDEQSHTSSIHLLVQEVIRLKWGAEEKIRNLSATIQLLWDSFPYARKTLEAYDQKRKLLPHLETNLLHLDAWQQEVSEISPALGQAIEQVVTSDFLTKMADGYRNLGNFVKQRDILERVLAIDEKNYGPDHPNVAITLANLGTAYLILGPPEKARELLERSLPVFERQYGSNHPNVTTILGELGVAYGQLGDAQKKIYLLERALAISENHYGHDHSLALILMNLGNAYGESGYYLKQRDMQEKALRIFEQHYGLNHPETAGPLSNLGAAYLKLEDYPKARDLLERALAIKEKHYGPDHAEVACTLLNLGGTYLGLKDAPKAHDLFERALSLFEKNHGSDHPDVARTLSNLGIASLYLGDRQKAYKLVERSLTIIERYYGPNHPEVKKILELFQKLKILRYCQETGSQPTVIEQGRSLPHEGVNSGKLVFAKLIKDLGFDIEAIDHTGYNALHLAVKKNYIDVFRFLLQHGAFFNAKTADQKTPLDIAKHYHHQVAIHLLDSVRLLFEGIQEGLDQDTVNFLDILSRDDRLAVMGACDRDGLVLLHYAAQLGCLKVVEYLLDQKINANIVAKKNAQWTPLHYAAKSNHLQIASALLKHGAIYSARDHQGRTPIQLTDNQEIKELLSVTDKLFNCVREGKLNELTGYLNHGAAIHARNDDGRTLVHVSAQNGYEEIIKTLLQRNMDVNALDSDNRTPLYLAVQENHLVVASTLLEQGANVNVLNEHQQVLVTEFMSGQQSDPQIQSYVRHQKAFLSLSKLLAHYGSDVTAIAVKQGLYLPSFESRQIKINGKCVALTRAFSQVLFSKQPPSHFSQEASVKLHSLFLNNLAVSAKLYERLAQGQPISLREEREIFALSKLLDTFEQQLDTPTTSLPSSLSSIKSYKTLGDLSSYITALTDNFAIHLVTSYHVVAIYRLDHDYAYFDSNVAWVNGLHNVDQLIKVIEVGIFYAGYELAKEGFLVEHFDVAKANNALLSNQKQILTKPIQTERHLLALQDQKLGPIDLNGQKLLRTTLYDLGTKLHLEGRAPLLINADINLNSENVLAYLNTEKLSVTARDYLQVLKGHSQQTLQEIVQTTQAIPFEGSRSEVKNAKTVQDLVLFEKGKKLNTYELNQLLKSPIDQCLKALPYYLKTAHTKWPNRLTNVAGCIQLLRGLQGFSCGDRGNAKDCIIL